MLRKLWSREGSRGVKWAGLCGKQHLKASYHIIRDQYLGDLGRFTIRAFPESQVRRLQGPLLAHPFFYFRESKMGREREIDSHLWKHTRLDRCKVWPWARLDHSPSDAQTLTLHWSIRKKSTLHSVGGVCVFKEEKKKMIKDQSSRVTSALDVLLILLSRAEAKLRCYGFIPEI